eukprot:s548_g6.t3
MQAVVKPNRWLGSPVRFARIWNGKITNIDAGQKMKEKCTKGKGTVQWIQILFLRKLPESGRFHPVEISCDGKYKIWNGKITNIDAGQKMKEKCTKGKGTPLLFLRAMLPYHYFTGASKSGQGHKPGDSYWGWIQKSKRISKENCPTLEEKSRAPALGNASAFNLLDCRSMTPAATCPSTSDKKECQETTVEYDGVRYVCYFTETTYGSISAALKENRCNVDMNSKMCQQVW